MRPQLRDGPSEVRARRRIAPAAFPAGGCVGISPKAFARELGRLRGGDGGGPGDMEVEGEQKGPFSESELKTIESVCSRCTLHPELLDRPELQQFKIFIERTADNIRSAKFAPKDPSKSGETGGGEPQKVYKDADGNVFNPVGHDGKSMLIEDPGEFKYPEYVPLPKEEDPDAIKNPDVLDKSEFSVLTSLDMAKIEEMEIPEEDMDAASELKSKGKKLANEGDFEGAVGAFKEAIEKDPSASIIADMAMVYLKNNRPNAAIFIADVALNVTDSAKALKVKGRAQNMLGQYRDALHNLLAGQKIDFDDATRQDEQYARDRMERITKPEEHKRKYDDERAKAKKVYDEKLSRWRKHQYRLQKEKEKLEPDSNPSYSSGRPGGSSMPGMDVPAPDMDNIPPHMQQGMADIMGDPEISSAMSNPATMAKMQAAMAEMQAGKMPNDPEILNLMQKISAKVGGKGGRPPPGMGGGSPFGGGNPFAAAAGGNPFGGGGGNPFGGAGGGYRPPPTAPPTPEAPRCQDID
uniref:STI1 domain-containing protein n=1 Tax=Lotharella oceanica TaxID=641309 RepID=A0A7S2TEK3_9EUKA